MFTLVFTISIFPINIFIGIFLPDLIGSAWSVIEDLERLDSSEGMRRSSPEIIGKLNLQAYGKSE